MLVQIAVARPLDILEYRLKFPGLELQGTTLLQCLQDSLRPVLATTSPTHVCTHPWQRPMLVPRWSERTPQSGALRGRRWESPCGASARMRALYGLG